MLSIDLAVRAGQPIGPAVPVLATSQAWKCSLRLRVAATKFTGTSACVQLELTFRQRDSSGERIRQDLEAVAAAMGVPLARSVESLPDSCRPGPPRKQTPAAVITGPGVWGLPGAEATAFCCAALSLPLASNSHPACTPITRFKRPSLSPGRRAQRLLQFAMRAVPLAADPHPVEVLYEDADLLAVNKPPGVITAPKHRYVGGSIVNRVKGGWAVGEGGGGEGRGRRRVWRACVLEEGVSWGPGGGRRGVQWKGWWAWRGSLYRGEQLGTAIAERSPVPLPRSASTPVQRAPSPPSLLRLTPCAGTLGFEPLTLHRLDMNTSGVVLFAKTRDVVPGLHAQFRCAVLRPGHGKACG